jgi:hypothetical protein
LGFEKEAELWENQRRYACELASHARMVDELKQEMSDAKSEWELSQARADRSPCLATPNPQTQTTNP